MLSAYDRAALFFGLESLEKRRLLAITASVNGSHVLNITGTSGNDTIVVNKLSNGKVSVTGVSTHFTPGGGSGQFNKINISAGGGNDTVTINSNVAYGSSTISGAGGNDVLTGGVGNDNIGGGAGNDTVDGGTGGADNLHGDGNLDTANYSYRTDNLTIKLDGQANDGKNGGAEGDNVQTEEVICGSGNDTVTGSPNDDFIAGGAGKDEIDGKGGNDVITGSSGSDKLLGDTGDDFIQAKNQDVDTVGGGTNPGDLDLASVDNIDVPAVQAQLAALVQAALVEEEEPAPGSPSDLDELNYGDGGIAVGPETGWDHIAAAAIDSQGRVIFVGSDYRFNGDGYGEDFVAVRYNEDGSFDSEFGDGGEAVIDFTDLIGTGYGLESDDSAFGVATGDGDTIFITGSAGGGYFSPGLERTSFSEGLHTVFALAKLGEDGTLDDNFGDGGRQVLDVGGFAEAISAVPLDTFSGIARDVAVRSDGSVVIAGERIRDFTTATYDPALEFSPDFNPAYPWSYGYSPNLDDPVTLYDTPTNVSGVDVWTSSELPSSETLAPDVQHNGSGETLSIPDGALALDPGFYGEFSHVTFTVPVTGTYDVSGSFDALAAASTDVHILVNGVSQFDDVVDVAGGESLRPV